MSESAITPPPPLKRSLGRRKKLSLKRERQLIKDYSDPEKTLGEIEKKFGVTTATIYNVLERHGVQAANSRKPASPHQSSPPLTEEELEVIRMEGEGGPPDPLPNPSEIPNSSSSPEMPDRSDHFVDATKMVDADPVTDEQPPVLNEESHAGGPFLNRDIEHPFPIAKGTRLRDQRPHGTKYLNFAIAEGPRKGLRVTVLAEAVSHE